MFSTVLKEITGSLDKRFVLTLFFPSLLFWGALAAVYGFSGDTATLIAVWKAQSAEFQAIQIVAALIWVAFFANVIAQQRTSLTRLFEGYWTRPPAKWFRNLRCRHYQDVLDALDPDCDADYEVIYYRYPLPDEREQVMPTRFGNILKNAELYPLDRYDADAVLLWPRLYSVLPESFAGALAATKSSVDLMMVLSALSAVFAVVSGAELLILGGPWPLFVGCFSGGLLISYSAYLNGIEAAIPYAQLIKAAFDLYRRDLIDKLGYDRPQSLEGEIKYWNAVNRFLYRGAAGDDAIAPPPARAAAPLAPAPPAPALAAPGERPQNVAFDWQKMIAVIFILLITAGGAWLLDQRPAQLGVPLATRDVPAYSRLQPGDLKTAALRKSSLPADAVLKMDALAGHYVRNTIPVGKPIRKSDLVPKDSLPAGLTDQTIGVSVDAGVAQTFAGKLQRGEVVAIWDRNAGRVLFNQILVIDVLPVPRLDANKEPRYTVIFAIPLQHQAEFFAAMRTGIDLTRVPFREKQSF
jgi:hypothetical protein